MFILIFLVVIILFIRALLDSYASSELRVGLGIASVFLLFLVIAFSLLMQREWQNEEDHTVPAPTPTTPTIEQTPTESANQTLSNQTPT